MKINDILKASGGERFGKINLDEKYNEIKINSKDVLSGDIFICIKGDKFDGHDFIDEAIENGAILVITSKKIDYNIPYILTDDTIKTMGLIASYTIDKYKPKVIAITGSIGKTTMRNLLYNTLSTKYNVLTNEKNYNNNIGVPLTIFKLNEKHNILLLELGMNHLGEISYLSKMIKPDISIITNIGSSHIGLLKSKENILKAKLEILDGMDKKLLFVNGDDEYLKNIDEDYAYKCGFNDDNDFRGYNLVGNLFSSSFDIKYNGNYKISVNLPTHLTNNVLTMIKVALYLDIDIEDIIKSLKEYKTFNNRMEIIEGVNNNTIISDCYNSSFESLTGVLKILKNYNQKKLLIIGDINELGSMSDEIHKKIKNYLDNISNKKVILVGEKIRCLKIDAKYFNNYKEVIDYLKTWEISNTLILIKASRFLKLENITNYFTN